MKELKKLIKAKYHSFYKYAKKLGISRVSLSYKLNGQVVFSIEEIRVIAKEFNLTDTQIVNIFIKGGKKK